MPEIEEVKEVKLELPKWKHPLREKRISSHGYSWMNWLEDWGKACDSNVLTNLLHIGFDVRYSAEENLRERIIFYLEVAHSYSSGRLYDFDREDSSSGEMRRRIAKKAWNILCQKIFKNGRADHEIPDWSQYILDEQVFLKVLWFFSFEDNIPAASYKDDHDSEIARKFLVRLVRILWESFGWDRPKPVFIEENKVQLLRIAFELGELNEFSSRDVSDEDMKILESFALKNRYDWKLDYESLEEAAVSASGREGSAAQTILMWRILRKERARQRSILAKAEAKAAKARDDIEHSKNRILEIEKVLKARDLPIDRTKLRKELKDLKEGLSAKEEAFEIAKEELKPIRERYQNSY